MDSKKFQEETARELDRQAGLIASLNESSEGLDSKIQDQDTRIATLERELGTLKDSQQTPPSENYSKPDDGKAGTDTDTDTGKLHEQAVEENARLNEQIGQLQERVTYLESPDHQTNIIQDFLRKLDIERYHRLGVRLGFLEDTEASPEDIAQFEGAGPYEVPLGDNKVLMVQKEKPEDMTGWEYSETQGLYIKVKPEG